MRAFVGSRFPPSCDTDAAHTPDLGMHELASHAPKNMLLSWRACPLLHVAKAVCRHACLLQFIPVIPLLSYSTCCIRRIDWVANECTWQTSLCIDTVDPAKQPHMHEYLRPSYMVY